MSKRVITVTAKVKQDYSVTASWADIPGAKCVVTEDGDWKIKPSLLIQASAGSGHDYNYAIGGSRNPSLDKHFINAGASTDNQDFSPNYPTIFLKKGQIVTMQALESSGTVTVKGASSSQTSQLTIEKEG